MDQQGSRPQNIVIDNFFGCNARCVMCPTRMALKRGHGPMADDVFNAILDQVSSFFPRIDAIYIGLHGEPLLDKKLEARIEACNQLGARKVVLTTNGSLMDKERTRSILDAGPSLIIISIESLRKAIYEAVRIGLHHDEVLNNILRFIELRDARASNVGLQIRFIQQKENEDEFQQFCEFWNTVIHPGLDTVFKTKKHNWAFPIPGISDYGDSPCPLFLEYFTVLTDGSVPLCCLDYDGKYHFGNVLQRPILDIFHSEAYAHVARIHRLRRRTVLRMCDSCYFPEYVADPDGADPYYEALESCSMEHIFSKEQVEKS